MGRHSCYLNSSVLGKTYILCFVEGRGLRTYELLAQAATCSSLVVLLGLLLARRSETRTLPQGFSGALAVLFRAIAIGGI